MTDKTNFKAKSTPRGKEGYFLMIIYQEDINMRKIIYSVHQEDIIIILNLYALVINFKYINSQIVTTLSQQLRTADTTIRKHIEGLNNTTNMT